MMEWKSALGGPDDLYSDDLKWELGENIFRT
jgi:hypothetical protein